MGRRRPPGPRLPKAWAAAALALAVLLVGSAHGAAAAAPACATADSAQPSRFSLSLASSTQSVTTRTRARAMITTTANEHCIKLTADMAGAADCATACCRNNTALARLSLSVAPGCVANATGIKRVKAATWRLAGKPVRAQLAKGVVQLAMPAGFKWAAEQQLCVSMKDETGPGAAPSQCITMEGLCGSAGCGVQMVLTGPKKTCCNAGATVTVATLAPCAPGSGGIGCEACARGTYSPGGRAARPRPDCAPCPDGKTTAAAAAASADACSQSLCAPGTAGANCTAAALGFFAPAATAADPTPEPQPCPAGFTTARMAAAAVTECTVPICKPGQGGAACKACNYGSFSAGGTAYFPNPKCAKCPSGGYTYSMGSRARSDCRYPFASRCAPGMMLGSDGACHRCPYDTWSPGGTVTSCTLCPGRGITKGTGSTSESACQVPGSAADGSVTWTDAPSRLLNQRCRRDVAALLGATRGDGTWEGATVAGLRTYDSCHATDQGVTEIEVFWRARLVAAGQLADFLAPDNPADLPPNWGLVGAASYAAVWGAVTAAGLADWTEVGGLEALYDASRASFAPGPMLAAIKALGADERAAVVSLLEDALNKRKAEANTFFGGKMNRERAVGWLLVRATRGAAQAYVAGLPNESGALRSTDVKMLRTLLPPGGGFGALSGGDVSAKDAIIDGIGVREVPVYDNLGNYRFIVCGSGITENGARAGMMAIKPFSDTSYCMKTANASGANYDTSVKYSYISDDSSFVKSLTGSLEVQASPFGVNVGAGAQFALDRTASVDSVFVTAMASKVQYPPVKLPTLIPPMTPESLSLLSSRGRAAFYATYGTHFVFGFRLGGYLSYMFQYQSNEQVTKKELAATLELSNENVTSSANASLAIKQQLATKGVNVIQSVRSNTYLPPAECGNLVVSQNFDPDRTGDCIAAWLQYPPEAAYGAFAMPFDYHPEFAASLPAWDTTPGTAVDDRSRLDLNYATGMLRVRLNQIKASLTTYPIKEDRFFGQVQGTIEKAAGLVDTLLSQLRQGLITSFAQWQQLYRAAEGQVNLASKQGNFVPAGAKCGWCTTVTSENREGLCSSRCGGTLECTLDCKSKSALRPEYSEPCRLRGFVYKTATSSDGVLSPECKTAVTGPQCLEFGVFGQPNGAFYCRQLACDWAKEYCDGKVEKNTDGIDSWGCLGTCKPRALSYYGSNLCSCSVLGKTAVDGHCVVGARVPPIVYFAPVDGGGAVRRQFWNSLDELQAAVAVDSNGDASVEVPFNNEDGIALATEAFLTTNCPTLQPVAVWNSTMFPGRPFPGVSDEYVSLYYPLSCDCSDSDGWWVPFTSYGS